MDNIKDIKCSICGFVILGGDEMFELRKKRHEERHDPRKKGISNSSTGKVEWQLAW